MRILVITLLLFGVALIVNSLPQPKESGDLSVTIDSTVEQGGNIEVVPVQFTVDLSNQKLSRETLLEINKSTGLKSLNLSGSYFKIEWLDQMGNLKNSLEELDLSGTLIQDKHIPIIKKFTSLKKDNSS